MKRKILYICFLVGIAHVANAQMSITPYVLPTQGNTLRNGNLVLTYTIGQPGTFSSTINNLMLTSGFQQPIKPLPPVAPASQTACSDSAYTFTFGGVQSGKGGNKIEWATNAAFTGSHILTSPANIIDTVGSGSTDTIWIRSVDVIDNTKSEAVFTLVAVHALPNAIITPVDTIVWIGQSAILTATGGESYSWPSLLLDAQNILITPVDDTDYYTAFVTNAYGCTDSAQAMVVTVDSLILSVTGSDNTLGPGDTTYITVIANIPGATITWERDNIVNVSGQTAGSGGVVKLLLVNNSDSFQQVNFSFTGTYGSYHAYAFQSLGYGLLNGVEISTPATSGDTVVECADTLTVTTKFNNPTSNTRYDTVTQVIPKSANIVSLTATCDSVTTLYDTINRTVYWYINNTPPDSCFLTMKLTFNCNVNSNDTSSDVNLITTTCASDTYNH